jgi:putative flippase GtrA
MIIRIREYLARLISNPRLAPLIQFFKFSLVGVSSTLISLGLYWLFLYVFHWHYQISNAVSFFISVVNAYIWNSRFVFREAVGYTLRSHFAAFGKSLVSYSGTFALNAALLAMLVEGLCVSEGLAPVLALVVTFPVNFLLNKYWAFRKGKKSNDTSVVPDK